MKRTFFYGLVLIASLFLSTGCQYWALKGNLGTDPDTNFVGTSDKQPLNIKVNIQPVIKNGEEIRT